VPGVAADTPQKDKPDTRNPREILADWGIQFSLTYIGETFANATGGISRGGTYTGRLDLGTTIDLQKLMGWTGATFHANMYQIHGDGLSRSFVGNLMLVSSVEALPSTRLYELWIEQALVGGKLLVKVGQQPSDVEFIDSKYDDLFANSALGWPGITGVDLPGGGPSPPLAVPGIRIKAMPTDNITAYLAIFDGYASPPNSPLDPQIANPHGVLFRVNDPPWIIGQLKYGFDVGEGHPATITGGGWKHLGTFDNLSVSTNGLPLADPLSTGLPQQMRGNQGIFAVYEQLLTKAIPGSDNGIGYFLRTSISPGDRNLIGFYLDGGIEFIGMWDARPNDKFGVAMTYAKISSGARQADIDERIYTGIPIPIRDYEAVLEMSYGAQITPNWNLQPIFEYVFHPGGGVVNPSDPTQTQRIKDAAVFGLRTTITY
jgi:porin